MAPEGIYRVTARGRFKDLNDQTHAYLVRQQPDHDIFKSAYTTEGTFTYDEKIQFFNLRYEVRTSEGEEDAARIGETEAALFLRTLGYSSHKLKITVANVSAMWEDKA